MKKAFTLIELLVVVSIIALLVSILLPALSRAKEQAKRVVCAHNQSQWGIALALYANDHDGKVLKSFTGGVGGSAVGGGGSGTGSGLFPCVWPVVEPLQPDGAPSGQINTQAMTEYMPEGLNFDGRNIGDPWDCPSARIDWKYFIDEDPRSSGLHNKSYEEVTDMCGSSPGSSLTWLPLCYSYFVVSDDMLRDPRSGQIRMQDEVVDNMRRDLARPNIDQGGRCLIMSDTLYRWPGGQGLSGAWWFNHSKFGPSTHDPSWSGRSYTISSGPPPITGANQLYTDGSVEWKPEGKFDTQGMHEGADPTVPQTLFGAIKVSPNNLACFW